jgi:hypothetical protein
MHVAIDQDRLPISGAGGGGSLPDCPIVVIRVRDVVMMRLRMAEMLVVRLVMMRDTLAVMIVGIMMVMGVRRLAHLAQVHVGVVAAAVAVDDEARTR